MNKRQAKKILRNINPYSYKCFRSRKYSDKQISKAHKVISKAHYHQMMYCGEMTRGFRWGRWDPHPSSNPQELPF